MFWFAVFLLFCHQRPTLLAKILGIYRIGFKNPQSSLRQDVLVMENLFYDRKIDKVNSWVSCAGQKEAMYGCYWAVGLEFLV